ncbi:unnamed protein product [Calypogeia fissa]
MPTHIRPAKPAKRIEHSVQLHEQEDCGGVESSSSFKRRSSSRSSGFFVFFFVFFVVFVFFVPDSIMRNLKTIAARFPLVCSCKRSSSEGDEHKEGRRKMAFSPTFRIRIKPGVAPSTGSPSHGTVSPSRLPSTRLSIGRPLSPAPSIVSSLATTDQTALKAERKDLAFTASAKVIPHPDKVAKGGEDAYFISSFGGGVLGVADGVSGWAEENVDPALFSKELMAHALAAVESEEVRNDPRRLLEKAHSSTASIGAATAIVAILEKNGILHVANLGDCGLRIVRQGKVVYATIPQQHYFDCPYQLSSESAQTADDATVYEVGVLEGDTIIMGSDGLFDNVYDSEIEATMQRLGGLDEDYPSRAATAMASLAREHAQDRNYDSPYAKEAIAQGPDYPWWYKIFGRKIGGKIDDITVVVGQIVGTPITEEVTPESPDTADGVATEQVSKEEQLSTVEQLLVDGQISMEEQVSRNVSAEEQVSAQVQVPSEDQISAEGQVSAEQQVSAEEQVSREESLSTEDQVSREENLFTEEQVSGVENISTEEQVVSAEQQVPTEEQVSKEEDVSTEDQVSKEEDVSTEDQVSKEEDVSTEEQVSKEKSVPTKGQGSTEGQEVELP